MHPSKYTPYSHTSTHYIQTQVHGKRFPSIMHEKVMELNVYPWSVL
jgi:hypothetical protein